MLIQCQHGLGDNIYARPFIRAAAEARPGVTIATPWPELFADLPVRFARPVTSLRTQSKNVSRQPADTWHDPDIVSDIARISYGHAQLSGGLTICQAIERHVPLRGRPFVFDLPPMGPCPIDADHPIAFVRPVTARKEWLNTARNPRPEYVVQIASELMATHTVVCVADLEEKREWLVGDLPPHHVQFLRGELDTRQLLALVAASDVVVGGVGWIVPAAVALKRPAFIILGGQAQHNSPEVIIDPRMDASRVAFAYPEEYCRCASMTHPCRKAIPDLLQQFAAFRTSSASSPPAA